MSVQRRKGIEIKLWPERRTVDSRGNDQFQVDMSADPYVVKGAYIPQRSSKAEVPGQVEINIIRILIPELPDDVGLFSRIYMQGDYWDVAAPPALHIGTRRTRHWSIDCRKRPGDVNG